MSRIGKKPVTIPAGVTITKDATRNVVVKGPKGELKLGLRPEIDVAVESGSLQVKVLGNPAERATRAYFGMTRAMIQNMVVGVVKGFEKKLEIQGVGWNAPCKARRSR
jgi:large subunit ribosomal protein L6